MPKTTVEETFAKRRKNNIKLLIVLLLFAIGLWAMTFFFRLNYIKGLAD